jgi:cytoskeletal protein CcmA (bactofilin family)
MFSKTRINEPSKPGESMSGESNESPAAKPTMDFTSSAPKVKVAASLLSSDLTITGNLKTTGDIQVEGTVEGDIRAHLLTVGESANIRGEVVADDIVINGRVQGTVRGLKVRLTSSARVEGDIIHKTIAIESGAQFEGTVQRQDDPLASGRTSGAPSSSRRVAAAPKEE